MTIATTLFIVQTLTFFAVIFLAFRAYRRSARPEMERAAMIPFQDDPAPGTSRDDTVRRD